MKIIQIDDTSTKGKALVDYLSTLDFVGVEEDEFQLSDEQIQILEERSVEYLFDKRKSSSWEEVKKMISNKNVDTKKFM